MAGMFQQEDFATASAGLHAALPVMNDTAFIPVSVPVYIGYSMLMGVVLLVGSALVIIRHRKGMYLVFGYSLMFALMFVNFHTFNANLLSLLAVFAISVLLAFLVRKKA